MLTEVTAEWTAEPIQQPISTSSTQENTKECERTIEIKENEHTLPGYSFSINILASSNLLHNQSESSNDHNNNTKKKDKYDDTTINVCIYCGRQFKNQGGMKKHMNSCKMRPHKIIDVKVPTVALDGSRIVSPRIVRPQTLGPHATLIDRFKKVSYFRISHNNLVLNFS